MYIIRIDVKLHTTVIRSYTPSNSRIWTSIWKLSWLFCLMLVLALSVAANRQVRAVGPSFYRAKEPIHPKYTIVEVSGTPRKRSVLRPKKASVNLTLKRQTNNDY
jgi:hypothetical protein